MVPIEIELLKTGNEMIDSQHTMIDRSIDQLKDIIINRSKSKNDQKVILERLIDYFNVHFYTEELFLSKLNLDEESLKSHTNEHRVFFIELKNLLDRESITIDLIIELQEWLKSHVSKKDIVFSSFYKDALGTEQ